MSWWGRGFTWAGKVIASGGERFYFPHRSCFFKDKLPVHEREVTGIEFILGLPPGACPAAGIPASYIAQWNGSEWSATGAGMNNTVDSLAVWGRTLYAGGIFTTAGGVTVNNIAPWDGSTWSAMGSGTSGEGGAGDVRTLATSGGILYAGGNFTTAGGVTANHVAAAVLEGPGFRGGPVGNADGSISLKGMSLTPSTNRLYAASNLIPPIVWQPIDTNFTGGFWQFTDTNIATFNSKFHRLSMP